MPVYEVEMESGETYRLDVDQEIPDTPAGRDMLGQLIGDQLGLLEAESQPRTTAAGVGKAVVGGVRDAFQGLIDTPVGLLNAALSFVNPQPPGPGRQPPPYQVAGPELPDVEAPHTTAEKGVRLGTNIAADLGLAYLAVPGGKRLVRKAGERLAQEERLLPKLYEAAEVRELGSRRPPRSHPPLRKHVPSKMIAQGSVLEEPLSEAAARVAKAFDVPSISAGWRNMSLRQAYEAKLRILSRIAGDAEVAESLPVKELLERVEMVILSHR